MKPNRRQVIAGASALAVGTLAPAAFADKDQRSLLIIGDWGRAGTQQPVVAAQMNVAAGDLNGVGVISVGDNFYEDGVQSVEDPKWRDLFENIYVGEHLQPLPWYVALGNHDYGGAPQAQVDYTARSRRWRMPDRYFKVEGRDMAMPEMDLFILDTNALVAENYEGEGRMAVNLRSQDAPAQLAWLERELAGSGARYKLVAGHHPIYSGGSLHGNTPDLIKTLLPLFKRYEVTAYLAGHDHDMQYIKSDGLHFIDAGAGCEARPVGPVAGTQFCAASPGFGVLTLTSDRLELQFRDHLGRTLYRSQLDETRV